MNTKIPHKVPCPTCKKPVRLVHENPYRPFCCHHCKLIDLGAWADESYKLPTQESPSSDDFENPH